MRIAKGIIGWLCLLALAIGVYCVFDYDQHYYEIHLAPSWMAPPFVLFLMIYWLLLAIWVGMDAGWRGMRPFAWGFLVLLTNFIGLFGYLIARLPAPRKCPNCGEKVLAKYVRCPACGVSTQIDCPICRRRMKPAWQFCPYCHGVAAQHPGAEPSPPPAEEPMQPTPRTANLDVHTLDAADTPLPNAHVSIQGPSSLEGLTSSQGVFKARRIRPGEYAVSAAKQGYESAKANIVLDEMASEEARLELRALPGRITGRVVQRASQQPIPRAEVSLDTTRIDRAARADAFGNFALDEIPAGPYTVRVDAEGFAPQTKLIEIAAGRQMPLDFALEPTAIAIEPNRPIAIGPGEQEEV